MKEVDKKETPEVSGGYYDPYPIDGPNPAVDYPQFPIIRDAPVDPQNTIDP